MVLKSSLEGDNMTEIHRLCRVHMDPFSHDEYDDGQMLEDDYNGTRLLIRGGLEGGQHSESNFESNGSYTDSSTSEDRLIDNPSDSLVDHWASAWTTHGDESMDVDESHGMMHHHRVQSSHATAAPVVPFHMRPAPTDLEAVTSLPRPDEPFSRLIIPSGSSKCHRGSLYIGNLAVASEMNWLTSNGVHFLLNCTEDVAEHFPHDTELTYKRVPLASSPDSSPFGHFEGAAKDVFEKLASGQTVLIFCTDGLRRALCIAFSYMMQYEGLTLMKSVEYMRQLKCNIFFTEGQQRALFELETTLRRPKEVKFLKSLSRPKSIPKKKEVKIMVKVKVKALPKKKLVRGTRPLSSIKAEDIRRSLSLAPLSPLLRRNMDATRQYRRLSDDDSKWCAIPNGLEKTPISGDVS